MTSDERKEKASCFGEANDCGLSCGPISIPVAIVRLERISYNMMDRCLGKRQDIFRNIVFRC